MYIVIVGGGKVGEYLADVLLKSGNEVAVIEKDADTADRLSIVLQGRYLIIHGDGCDSRYQEDAGIRKADVFAAGDKVDVTGTSKGKGYAGVIKRWNFQRLKESHGSGPVARHGGSMGACSSPSRVWKGKKMAGHLGAERVTVQNLAVVKVDAENNLIAIKGAVPGPNGGIVVIRDTVKA